MNPWDDESGIDVPLWRRLAWPAAITAGWAGWYAAQALRHRSKDRGGYEVLEPVPPASPRFRQAAEALTGHATTEGNRADVLINGDRIFPPMLEAIRAADHHIDFETYAYWRGEIAEQFAAAICERARAGVRCRVLLDSVGAARMDPRLFAQMRDAGAEAYRFRPPLPHLLGRASNRSHRRVMVVDGRVGFTGGVGIASEWTGDAEDPDHWRDTHIRVEGPIVRGLSGAFAEHWLEATGEALVGGEHLPELEPAVDGVAMQVVRSGYRSGDSRIEILYFLAIASARQSIDLTAAYFSPRPPFVSALCDAVGRGVRVRILLPGPHMAKELVRLAGRSTYEALLDGGVEIYEYQPTMLHAKSLVVDGCWSSVGTVNFDNRSFELNDELTLSCFDAGLAGRLGEEFERDLDRSERIEPDRYEQRGIGHRLAEAATAPLRREL